MYSKMKNFEHLKWHTLSVTKHNYLSSAKRCYKYPLQWQGPPSLSPDKTDIPFTRCFWWEPCCVSLKTLNTRIIFGILLCHDRKTKQIKEDWTKIDTENYSCGLICHLIDSSWQSQISVLTLCSFAKSKRNFTMNVCDVILTSVCKISRKVIDIK